MAKRSGRLPSSRRASVAAVRPLRFAASRGGRTKAPKRDHLGQPVRPSRSAAAGRGGTPIAQGRHSLCNFGARRSRLLGTAVVLLLVGGRRVSNPGGPFTFE